MQLVFSAILDAGIYLFAKHVLIKHIPHRSPVFYLLSALDTDQQEPFDNAPVLGAGEESIFNLLSSYRPLKAQELIRIYSAFREPPMHL